MAPKTEAIVGVVIFGFADDLIVNAWALFNTLPYVDNVGFNMTVSA